MVNRKLSLAVIPITLANLFLPWPSTYDLDVHS